MTQCRRPLSGARAPKFAWVDDAIDCGIHATECHVSEHDGVLEIAREVHKRAAAGKAGFGRVLAQAVAQWFANHAASMDNVLALYMKEAGFKGEAAVT
jgi:hemerythrin